MFFDRLKFFPFLFGLSLGLFVVYVIKPAAIVVMQYPNMDNAGKLVYRDRNGTCFKYEIEERNCDADEDKIKPYPLQ